MSKKIKVIIIIAIALIAGFFVFMNIPDIRAGRMLKNDDYYKLNQYLPKVEKRLNPVLSLMITAVTGSNFNRYDESNTAVDHLLNFFSLDDDSIFMLAGIKLSNLFFSSEYKEFKTARNYYMQRYSFDPSPQGVAEICSILEDTPQMSVSLPEEDVELPFVYRPTGDGETLRIEAAIRDTTGEFIFDTNFMKWNMTTESLAEKYGIHIIYDSWNVFGEGGSSRCKIGVLDSMSIGSIKIYNAVFIVVPDGFNTFKMPDGKAVNISNVIGTDIIYQLKEVRIDNARSRMVIPHRQTQPEPLSQNLICHNGRYALYLYADGEFLKFHFDTGSAKSCLNKNYYKKHSSYIKKQSELMKGARGRFGGVIEVGQYMLPALDINIRPDEKISRLNNVAVIVDGLNAQEDEYGSLGIDFIQAYDTITINFDKMFVLAN